MLDCVVLRLRGRMLEKFISRAVESGICLRRVGRTASDEMRIEAASGEAQRLLALAGEYRMDLTVVKEHGLPVFRRRFRERGSLPVGIALGLMLIVMFTSRIWRVEALSLDGMAGAEMLDGIVRTANELGVSPGKLRSSIDRDLLALNIQNHWPELTHVSVRLEGVSLQVEVACEEAAPEVYEIEKSRDLVALYDAVIVHVDALAGKAAVQSGDTVRRGQVLIRGEERADAESMHGVRALGSVTGRMWTEAECRLPTQRTVSRQTGNMNSSSVLRLGKWILPLSQGRDYEHQEIQTELLPVGGLYLPVRIERTIRRETNEESVPEDRNALLRQGEAWALELARGKLPEGAQENAHWFDYSEENGMLTVKATIEAQTDIAVERSALMAGSNE